MVGPNGSGKSNVIDAMLFVFGKRAKQVCPPDELSPYRATKLHDCAAAVQLRLNKVSELIHNSTNHKNLPMAKVCVYFQEIIDTVCSMPVPSCLSSKCAALHKQMLSCGMCNPGRRDL